MGCLLAEFKLTAMLFGGERTEEVVRFGCRCFLGVGPLCTLRLSSLTFTSHWRSRRLKKKIFLEAGLVLSGSGLMLLFGNMLLCKAE